MLAIMSIMLTLVGARLFNTIESTRFSRTAEAAMADILIYRAEAMLAREGRFIVTQSTSKKNMDRHSKSNLRYFNVPKNWSISGDAIEISSSGICNGSLLTIRSPEGRRAVFHLSPPNCKAQRVSDI